MLVVEHPRCLLLQEVVATRQCTLYELGVDAFRNHLVSNPALARRFWAATAVKLAGELAQIYTQWAQLAGDQLLREALRKGGGLFD